MYDDSKKTDIGTIEVYHLPLKRRGLGFSG
jgi:hypothetical protein